MSNFWQQLKKPFFTLAPMYDVTDAAFRAIIAKYGKPDVFFTEFVSVSGLCSEEGRPKLLRELYYTEAERPIVAQVFGNNPDHFRQAAKLIKELGFDGIDINMGCPDRTIIKQGAGGALIKDARLAQEIIQATKEGFGSPKSLAQAAGLPVSVKTRIGFSKIDEMEKWLKAVAAAQPAALTVHLRTVKEMSEVPAHWELMPKVVEIVKNSGIPLSGNGDVKDLREAREKAEKYGIDGVMVGRGVFGRPELFSGESFSLEKRLQVMIEHTKLFEDLYGNTETNKKLFGGPAAVPPWAQLWRGKHPKNFAVMKKHFKAYVSGFRGASELRARLMDAENAEEVEKIVGQYLTER